MQMESTAVQKSLTEEEIANLLQVKKSTIYNRTHIGFILHTKPGNRVRFREEDISSWPAKRSVKGRSQRPKHRNLNNRP